MIVTQTNIVMIIAFMILIVGVQFSSNFIISSALILAIIMVFADKLERKYIYKEKKEKLK